MPTSTTVKGLNINELTEAQYDAAVQGGVIGPNELSIITDLDESIQVTTLPTASAGELGKIYQFVGTTDASYTNGYFYKCVSDGQTPATYSWEQTDVMPAGSSLPDQTGQSGKFLTTDGTDASWAAVSALQNTATGTYSLTILGTPTTATNATNICEGSSVTGEGGLATGRNSTAGKWGAAYGLGASATGMSSVALGRAANVNAQGAIAIGNGAQALNLNGGAGSIAIGQSATANNTGAIQIGQGTNSVANTFKVGNANGNYEIMSADGTIPTARLTNAINKYSSMPTASADYLGQIAQFTGTTDSTYTHGHLYECVSDGADPATYSWTEVQLGGGSSLPDQTGNSGKFLTTDGTDASWSDKPLVNTATQTTSLGIGGTVGANNTRSVVVGAGASTTANWATVYGGTASVTGQSGMAIGNCHVAGAYSIFLSNNSAASVSGQRSLVISPRVNAGGGLGADDTIVLGSVYSLNGLSAKTFYVGLDWSNAAKTYELLSSDGTIPTARLTKVNSTITLTVAGWSNGSQTVTVSGVTSSSIVWVSPDPTDQSAYVSAGILCTAQGTDSLTFTATTTPSADIDVVVVAM